MPVNQQSKKKGKPKPCKEGTPEQKTEGKSIPVQKLLGSGRRGGGLPSGLRLLTIRQDMSLFQTMLVGPRKSQDSVRSTNLKTSPVSTDKLINLNPVLEEKESGHGTDAQLGSNVRDFVNVQLEEFNTLDLARESLKVRRNHFAGTYW